MKTKYTSIFAIIYGLVSLAELVGEKIYETSGTPTLILLSKPLLMPVLLLWMLTNRELIKTRFHRYIMVSLVFSMAGDCFLMLKNDDLFIFGLGSFLVAHILYILAFARNMKTSPLSLSPATKVYMALPFAAFVAVFLYILQGHILADEKTKDLMLPVAVYATVIGTMGVFALYRLRATNALSFRYIVAGALTFIASDSMIAVNKFITPLDNAALLIMTTYILAQYLIVKGTLCHTTPQPR